MYKAFKYRIYPTKKQSKCLEETLGLCRQAYNHFLNVRKDAWEKEKKSVTRFDTIKLLAKLKAERPELGIVYSQTLQNVCDRLDKAFQGFFRRVKNGEKPGYPRFRGKSRYNSFTYPQSGFRVEGNRIVASKIGELKIRLHRHPEGTMKTLTLSKTLSGKWFAIFINEIEPQLLSPLGTKIGIDVGLENFATMSDGTVIKNPRFFRQFQNKITKTHRILSKAPKGSKERERRRKILSLVYEKMCNKRYDFVHKLARAIVDKFGMIALEKLSIKQLVAKSPRGLRKSLQDVAWNQFMNCVANKAEYAGRKITFVNPRNTSQICSKCGEAVPKKLSERKHDCPRCGLNVSRDFNASLNILRLGTEPLALA